MSETTQRRLSLTGAFVCYLVILLVASEPDVAHIDWGDAPTWIAGGIALLALVAAWRAGSIAAELLRVEQRREDDRAKREASSQASLVSAWIEVGYERDELDNPIAVESLTCFVRNASPVPVHDVKVIPLLDRRSKTRSGREWIAANLEFPTLPPTDQPLTSPIRGPVVSLVDSAAEDAQIAVRCTIEFTDSSGTRWVRYPSGELTVDSAYDSLRAGRK